MTNTNKYLCNICDQKFSTTQARGSHVRYTHPQNRSDSSSAKLDLKEDFKKILKDVGVRNRVETLVDIIFDTDADDLKNVEKMLRLGGVTNPALALIITRWSQRTGKDIPGKLLKEKENETVDVFEAYDRMMDTELRGVMLDEIRTRIEQKKGSLTGKTGELGEKLDLILLELKTQQRKQRRQDSYSWSDSNNHQSHFQSRYKYFDCHYCGYAIYVGRLYRGDWFDCPDCKASYVL